MNCFGNGGGWIIAQRMGGNHLNSDTPRAELMLAWLCGKQCVGGTPTRQPAGTFFKGLCLRFALASRSRATALTSGSPRRYKTKAALWRPPVFSNVLFWLNAEC